MYKISVPVMNSNFKRAGAEKTIAELKRLNAERVFLALDRYETDPASRAAVMAELKESCALLKSHGFEVGAWTWTFWIVNNTQYTNMRSINGTEIKEFMCPTDEAFTEFACGYIKDIATCGVDLIMFDDDFRFGNLSDSPACLCDRHIAEINRITGDSNTREELSRLITEGGKNKYRDAYLKANGDSFRAFAKAVRQALDEVNPKIRLGACACMSAWDIDGASVGEIAHLLAGNTKPFARLIGAPYWAVNKAWGNSLQDVIELERMESSWTRDGEIELMAEGDAYPRPRSLCPASYIEGFDTAIRAAGCTDGILKYGIDYVSNADYETGYAERHIRNRELYEKIDKYFGSKASVGVRIYEPMKKIADTEAVTRVNSYMNMEDMIFSKAARTLAYNTIPTVYEGSGICGAVFDEAARSLPLEALNNGLILDIAAAEILTERGIDVGIKGFFEEDGKAAAGLAHNSDNEHFIYNGNRISSCNSKICNIELRDSAEVLSDIETASGKLLPVSYRYENADGQRFLVLNINTRIGNSNLLFHYERSRQYAENIPWLSGKRLPAYVYGNPALYIQCKSDGNAMAVGLWNFFADTVYEPEIILDKPYSSISFINCNGRLEGDRVYLTDISPFGFAGFEVL